MKKILSKSNAEKILEICKKHDIYYNFNEDSNSFKVFNMSKCLSERIYSIKNTFIYEYLSYLRGENFNLDIAVEGLLLNLGSSSEKKSLYIFKNLYKLHKETDNGFKIKDHLIEKLWNLRYSKSESKEYNYLLHYFLVNSNQMNDILLKDIKEIYTKNNELNKFIKLEKIYEKNIENKSKDIIKEEKNIILNKYFTIKEVFDKKLADWLFIELNDKIMKLDKNVELSIYIDRNIDLDLLNKNFYYKFSNCDKEREVNFEVNICFYKQGAEEEIINFINLILKEIKEKKVFLNCKIDSIKQINNIFEEEVNKIKPLIENLYLNKKIEKITNIEKIENKKIKI